MYETIFKLASAIAQPAEGETQLLEALCTAAAAETARRLRPELTPEDCGGAFPCAAALLAAAGLLPCREDGGLEQLTAGEVTLRLGGGCEAGAALRRQAAAMMEPYWLDDDFAFMGVKG